MMNVDRSFILFPKPVFIQTEEKEDEEEEALVGEVKASPNADTTILFVKGEGECLWFLVLSAF